MRDPVAHREANRGGGAGPADEGRRVLHEAARYEQKLRARPTPPGALATLGFAALGATFGALAGPIGIPAGIVFGALVGAAVGVALSDEWRIHVTRDHELDDLIGVTSGRLGHPLSPAATRSTRGGAFSAASMGISGAATTPGSPPDGGPIPRGDA